MNAHILEANLREEPNSTKIRQIRAIQREGLEAIVRIIARGLTDAEALLVEKTLLWQLGKQLTNIATGHYAANFRPDNTLHKRLNSFDYQNGFYYYNVGECEYRCWNDYRNYGFISAGHSPHFRDEIVRFEEGDIIAAYLRGNGYVGIGQIIDRARPVRDVILNNQPLSDCNLEQPNLILDSNDENLSEFVALVEWFVSVGAADAKWVSRSGLFSSQRCRASLDNQPVTVSFLEESFNISIEELLI
tara:strand:+ start:158 stop:895 length:738 start_codon:yes stop_codon:yes gene_type:complete